MVISTPDSKQRQHRPVVACGPRLPGIGSWDWIGADLATELEGRFQVTLFEREIPHCDLLLLVKYDARDIIFRVPSQVPILFCPVDAYGSAAEIDADWRLLRRCARVIVHAEPLRRYFQSYARIDYLDHHLKFHAPLRTTFVNQGPILWVGMRSNLPPLVRWVNRQPLPAELIVLTNLPDGESACRAAQLGFRAELPVRVEAWSAARQRELTTTARGAIDVKGDDFRQRHKPPAKAIDFIASGLPLAMNADSSSSRHLRRLGFNLAVPEESERWLSRNYWEETTACGQRLLGDLSRQRVAATLARIIEEVLAEQKVYS